MEKISVFLSLRAMRIFPALVVEVFLSALLIGPLLTYDHLSTYFASRNFWSYFLNVTGDIHYVLPGVFTKNPMPTVNVQLWTIPYELKCYILIVALALLGVLKRRNILLFFIVSVTVLLYAHLAMTATIPNHFDKPNGRALILSFLLGNLIFVFKEKITLSAGLFTISAITFFFIMMFPQAAYLAPFPASYMTIYLGLLNPPRVKYLFAGDYSYGIYLYGYPVQQIVSQVLPRFRFWYVNLVLSLLVVGIIAYCSWTFVEYRVLSQKKVVIGLVEWNMNKLRHFMLALFGGSKRKPRR